MTESATRTRTRQAILAAAVTVFARDPSASLGEVAAAAGVGRTTLHRYFAERSDLLSALAIHLLEAVAAAMERAAPTLGPAPEALGRVCREYFELGDVLTVLFNEPSGIGADVGTQEECGARPRLPSADRARAGRGQHRPGAHAGVVAVHVVGVAVHRVVADARAVRAPPRGAGPVPAQSP